MDLRGRGGRRPQTSYMDVVKEDMYGWCERRLVRDSVRWRQMACCGDPWWMNIYISQKYSFYIAFCKLLGSLSWLRLLTLLHVMRKVLSWANSVAAVLEKLLWQQFWIIEPCFYIGTSDNTSADQYDAYETGDMPIWPYSRCLALFNMSCLKSLILSQWKK